MARVYSVSQLTEEIKNTLETKFVGIWVEGEISDFKTYPSGHAYFVLKDDQAQLRAVYFQYVLRRPKFELATGQKVLVFGDITLFSRRGEYQISVSKIEPKGLGARQLALEQLKKKLAAEGLFDAARKKSLPVLVQRIGVVTSPSGAAIRDILTVIRRRFANVEIYLYPVQVQGELAAPQIAEAIADLNRYFSYLDVLLVGRGGGSVEDLWAFNEEIVVRAIAASRIPVISCVGHEIDWTLSDLAADIRAPTPSAGAEMVVRCKSDIKEKLADWRHRLIRALSTGLDRYRQRLAFCQQNRYWQKPESFFANYWERLDEIYRGINEQITDCLKGLREKLQHTREKIILLNPTNILKRGYAICFGPAGEVVSSVKNVRVAETLRINLSDGLLECRTEKILPVDRE